MATVPSAEGKESETVYRASTEPTEFQDRKTGRGEGEEAGHRNTVRGPGLDTRGEEQTFATHA